ncbi:hypothetical protein Dimus_022542 [Dionaea muscipula]
MELIKRQKWENLFKRRELVHTDAVKEFYAKMSVIHLKKKDIVKSKVRGVEIEFDHEKLATILGIHGNNGICEYVKDVWEESKYIKPLEITRRFANNETLTATRREVERTRRRDNDGDAPEVEAEDKDEGNKDDFELGGGRSSRLSEALDEIPAKLHRFDSAEGQGHSESTPRVLPAERLNFEIPSGI